MTLEEILNGFRSRDCYLAKKASFAVYTMNCDAIRKDLSPYLEEIKEHVDNLSLPATPAISDARDWSRLAVSFIEKVESGKCRCVLYNPNGGAVRHLPKFEEMRGLVSILSKTEIPWEDEYVCSCNECGQQFFVKEDHAYHYPVATWKRIEL